MLAAQREPRHARLFLQIGNLCVKTTPTKVARPADRSCSCGGEPAAARERSTRSAATSTRREKVYMAPSDAREAAAVQVQRACRKGE